MYTTDEFSRKTVVGGFAGEPILTSGGSAERRDRARFLYTENASAKDLILCAGRHASRPSACTINIYIYTYYIIISIYNNILCALEYDVCSMFTMCADRTP